MSSVAIARTLLAQSAALVAQVPAASIFVGNIPVGSSLPAIGVSMISGVERETVTMAEASRFRSDRVQATVHATSQASKNAILELVRAALVPARGAVAGFDLDSILPAGEGPDLDDEAPRIYERSRDFMVRWRT